MTQRTQIVILVRHVDILVSSTSPPVPIQITCGAMDLDIPDADRVIFVDDSKSVPYFKLHPNTNIQNRSKFDFYGYSSNKFDGRVGPFRRPKQSPQIEEVPNIYPTVGDRNDKPLGQWDPISLIPYI